MIAAIRSASLRDAPEWLAAMCSHVPNRGEQMVRYYGWYSNVTRGKRRERAEDNTVPYLEARRRIMGMIPVPG